MKDLMKRNIQYIMSINQMEKVFFNNQIFASKSIFFYGINDIVNQYEYDYYKF